MAYKKKAWADRQSEYPNRRRLTAVAGVDNVYEIAREEGLVVEEGHPFDQVIMNDMEGRVEAAFVELTIGTVKAGRAVAADSADSASTVAWGGVSGKPTTFTPTAHSHSTDYTATIGTGWSGSGPWTQNVAVAGITAADTPWVDVMLSGTTATDIAHAQAWGMVSRVVTYAGGITATCLDFKPTVAIPVQIKVVR